MELRLKVELYWGWKISKRGLFQALTEEIDDPEIKDHPSEATIEKILAAKDLDRYWFKYDNDHYLIGIPTILLDSDQALPIFNFASLEADYISATALLDTPLGDLLDMGNLRLWVRQQSSGGNWGLTFFWKGQKATVPFLVIDSRHPAPALKWSNILPALTAAGDFAQGIIALTYS